MGATRTIVVLGIAATAVGCSGAFGPRGGERYIGEDSTETLTHPSATGSVEANKLEIDIYQKGQETWFSLTTLTDRQICIDFGKRATGELVSTNKAVEAALDEQQRRPLAIYVDDGYETTPMAVKGVETAKVIETSKGTIKQPYQVDTGRTATQCVKDIVNRYGTVVGCDRYEQVAVTETRYREVPATFGTVVGGIRFCASNNGAVAATTTALDFETSGHRKLRFRLTGGNGGGERWGGTGGTPAVDGALTPDPNATAATSKPASPGPATAPERPQPARPQPAEPSSRERLIAAIKARATARLRIEPVTFYGGRGPMFADLQKDGTLLVYGRETARIHRNGLITIRGIPVMAVDREWNVWGAPDGSVKRILRIRKGKLTELTGAGSIELKAGRVVLEDGTGKTRVSKQKLVTRGNARLTLLVAGLVSDRFTWR